MYLIFSLCLSRPHLIIFYHVMNLWKLTQPDCISLVPLAALCYLSWPMIDTSKTLVSGEREK